jgi:predicted N-acyltransferase
VFEIRIHPSIAEVPAADWDALDGARGAPFLSWAWLHALEATGCVGEEAGWIPHHLTIHEEGKLRGAAPCYLKDNSEGEFVFDYAWANAAHRCGVRYYPKLLCAVPFTPATGARLLVADESDRRRIAPVLVSALRQIVDEHSISSAHVLFPSADEADLLEKAGLSHRYGVQFQWKNAAYGSFEDFLGRFPSKRRTQIRRERRAMRDAGIEIATLRGSEMTPAVVDAMYAFYLATVDKFTWGRRYLNRAFFEEVCAKVPGVEIVLARDSSRRPIAGAFNVASDRVLYGRYWGAAPAPTTVRGLLAGTSPDAEQPFLHFNVCYYHSIEDCIARGLTSFEPGAGGSHKVSRGFDPEITHSVHHIREPNLDEAIRDFLERERKMIRRAVASGGEAFR